MRYRMLMLAALIACGAWFSLARGEEVPATKHTVADLAWLTGAWRGTVDGGEWEAVYTSPDGGEMISANKEYRGGNVGMIEFEYFRMVDNKIVMTPFPYAKRSDALFTLSELDVAAKRATFRCPEHDFPNEIVYHRAADDRLVIDVSGVQGGQPLKLTLDLRLQK